MRQRFVLIVLILAVSRAAAAQVALDISLKHDTPAEGRARDQLRRLVSAYDVFMDFWATDHYTWVYQTVISRSADIARIMRDRKLMPAL